MGDRRPMLIGAALVVCVIATGCSGGDSGGSVPEGPGPLAELMGWEPEEPAEMRRKELAVEEAAAECMHGGGWEYQPVDYSSQMPDLADEDVAMFDDPEAFGEKYGYGVVRNYEQYEAEAIESGEGGKMGGDEFVDPNQEYVESLSQSEMEEYYASLYGDPSIWEGAEDAEEFVNPPLEDQGCQGKARLEVYGEDPMESNADIQERMNDYWASVNEDPRMVTATEEWLDCMGEVVDGLEANGEPVDEPNDMYMHFDSRKMEAMGLEVQPFDDSDPHAWNEDVYTVMGDETGENEWAWMGKPEPISDADLEQLRSAEVETWKVDWECQKDADLPNLQRQIEQEFADELRADFPELADEPSES